MADTAQPVTAAETEVAPTVDPMDAAAEAFKVSLGQSDAPERPRGPDGKFVAAQTAEEEIEAPANADEAEAGAETPEEGEETDEAAEEAQPEAVPLPHSWPPEKAEVWSSLPPEAQAVIAEREGQRDAAVNAKFQEAANVRKANEGLIAEANVNRQRYADGLEQVMSLIQPQWPSSTMLDINSGDYDPDTYHLMRANAELDQTTLQNLSHQRQQLRAQVENEEAQGEAARFQQINNASRDSFVKLCPDAVDQQKAPAAFQELMSYAIEEGAPADLFASPTTSLEWKMIWKAREYDRLQSAKAKVGETPPPEPRRAQPVVRPGVTTPRSAATAARQRGAMDRLRKSGSVEDGAAALKHLMKGL